MANEQKIDEIIDQKAFDQLTKLEAELGIVTKSLADAILAAEKLTSVLGNTDSYKGLNKAASDLALAQAKVQKIEAETAAVYEKTNLVKIKSAEFTEKTEARKLAAFEKTEQAEAKKLANATARVKTIISNSKAEIDAYNSTVNGSSKVTSTLNEQDKAYAKTTNDAVKYTGASKSVSVSNVKVADSNTKVSQSAVIAQKSILQLQIRLQAYQAIALKATDPKVLSEYNGKIQDTETEIKRLGNVGKEGFDDFGNAIEKSKGGLSGVWGGLKTVANLLPGIGIAGLLAFAIDPIMEYISTLDLFAKKLNQLAETRKQVNEVNLKGAQNAQLEIVQLKTLYDVSQDVSFSIKERNKYIDDLQNKYPDYLGNISKEDFRAGKASEAYDRLNKSIIATARARASQDKIAENASRQLEDEQKIVDLQAEQLLNRSKLREATKQAAETPISSASSTGAGTTNIFSETAIFKARKLVEDTDKKINDLATDHNILRDRNLALEKNITKQIKSGADLLDDINTKRSKTNNPETDAITNKIREVEGISQASKSIVDNDKETYEVRLQALEVFTNVSIELIKLHGEKELQNTKLTSAGREAVEKNTQNKIDKIRQDGVNKQLKITDEVNKVVLELFTKQEQDEILTIRDSNNTKLQLIEQYRAESIQALNEQYASGLISKKQYESQLLDIDNQASSDSIQVQIDALKKVVDLEKSLLGVGIDTNKSLADDEKKLADLQIALSKKTTDAKIKDLEKTAERNKQLNSSLKELGQDVFNFGIQLGNATYERRLNEIQGEMDASDKKKQFDIEQVNDSVGTEAEKADKIAIINARAAAQQDILDKKKRDEQLRQAKFQKAANIFQIAGNTAVAVMKTYSEFGFPFGIPLAIAQAAIGAVQIATVLATPLPKYYTGTDNSKAGLAWTDELGPELYIEPGGKMFVGDNKPNIKDLKAGTQIIPHDELVRMVAKPDLLFKQDSKIDLSPLQSTIKDGNNKLIKAINNNKQPVYKNSKRGFLADSELISSMTDYIKRNF